MDHMSDIQFFILLGTVLAGVIWQRVDYHQLQGRMDRMSDDMRVFYRDLGKHDGRLDAIERRFS